MLFEMLTGGPPYTGRSLTEVATRILRASIPSVQSAPGRAGGGRSGVSRALAKSAAERFATMEEFAAALSRAAVGSTG